MALNCLRYCDGDTPYIQTISAVTNVPGMSMTILLNKKAELLFGLVNRFFSVDGTLPGASNFNRVQPLVLGIQPNQCEERMFQLSFSFQVTLTCESRSLSNYP